MKSADFKSAVNDELIFFHAYQILVVEYINGRASVSQRERKVQIYISYLPSLIMNVFIRA